MNEKSSYSCPYCGQPTTFVSRTASFNTCIIRTRKCQTCGMEHETTEIGLEISRVWREAACRLIGEHEVQITLKASQDRALKMLKTVFSGQKLEPNGAIQA